MTCTFVVVYATSYVDVGVLDCTKYFCPEILHLLTILVLLQFLFSPHLHFELPMLLVILVILGLKLYV